MNRRLILAVLGAAALVSMGLAAFALHERAAEGARHYTPARFLPGFTDRVKDVTSIHIESRSGTVEVTYSPKTGWVLPQRGGYPADFDTVRRTLIGLATLETIAPKTARADWLHFINLDAPPKGSGTRITVKDAKGQVLADLITGNTEDIADPSGNQGLFVRRPDETQSYLARTVFVPHSDIASWLMTRPVEISAGRLKDVAVKPAKGPAFTVGRAKAGDPLYKVDPLPKGRNADPRKVNSIPFSLTTFSFDDVRPVGQVDFSKAAHLVAHTFDGLAVRFDVVSADGGIWARVSAAADPGAVPAVAAELRGINMRAARWAYKLPEEKGRPLLNGLEDMMLPKGASPIGAGMPGMPGRGGG